MRGTRCVALAWLFPNACLTVCTLAVCVCVCVCVCVSLWCVQHGRTPLHVVALGCSVTITQSLVAAGADLHALDNVRVQRRQRRGRRPVQCLTLLPAGGAFAAALGCSEGMFQCG